MNVLHYVRDHFLSHPRALFHTEIKAKRLGLDLE